ncbi:hypothetical protein [Limnoglobus roseus]|uniref:Uncharacterized protein n=1 Tax=Limnoglobus roseus TaxID=2598579 RepID=A0A5C1AE87_9BACT|nr:hypothetical protein [Limnoglobus roseus]QEL16336.1 hypothetical protein PX52LOC_03282 [Limnoglobus roseus]
MRKLLLALSALAVTVGFTIASEVSFVKYDADKKELTVKEGDKEATYKVTDETKVKRGEKDAKLENVLKHFSEKAKAGDAFELTADKDKKTVSEIKLKGGKKQ